VQGMEKMIVKGWDKIGITRAFQSEFQFITMEANMISSLFKVTPNIKHHIMKHTLKLIQNKEQL
jgi:hypothetical protein